jgi:hypothetical protein
MATPAEGPVPGPPIYNPSERDTQYILRFGGISWEKELDFADLVDYYHLKERIPGAREVLL